MRLYALAGTLLLLTAGCIGSEDDTGDEVGPTSAPPTTETVPPVEEAAPGAWKTESFEGSVTSVNAVVLASNPDPNSDSLQEFAVEAGATELVLNVTADGGELNVYVGGPDCSTDITAIAENCEEVVTTSGGAATWSTDQPADGTWQVRFFGSEPGPTMASWTLTVTQLVGPAMNMTA